jgi:hypothetical protein
MSGCREGLNASSEDNCKKIQAIALSPTKKGVKLSDAAGKKGGVKRKADDELDGPEKKKKPIPKVTKGRKGGMFQSKRTVEVYAH